MIDVYSPALATAIAGAVISALLTAGERFSDGATARVRSIADLSIVVSGIALAVSVVSHFSLGHARGSPNSMTVTEFVAAHPALVLTAAGVLIVVAARRRLP